MAAAKMLPTTLSAFSMRPIQPLLWVSSHLLYMPALIIAEPS